MADFSLVPITQLADVSPASAQALKDMTPKGDKGDAGKSAYQLWLDAGNAGTVNDFFASLKGDKGDKGDPGTGGEGSGEPGASAYQVWIDNGNAGTVDDFLASLKGDKGDPGDKGDAGDKGEQGEQGLKGDQGDPGKSAYRSWLDAGNAGTEADFLASLKGADGADGAGGGGMTAITRADLDAATAAGTLVTGLYYISDEGGLVLGGGYTYSPVTLGEEVDNTPVEEPPPVEGAMLWGQTTAYGIIDGDTVSPTANSGSGSAGFSIGSGPLSGKLYFEMETFNNGGTVTSGVGLCAYAGGALPTHGIGTDADELDVGGGTGYYQVWSDSVQVGGNNNNSTTMPDGATRFGIAVDVPNRKVWVRNVYNGGAGNWHLNGDAETGDSPTWTCPGSDPIYFAGSVRNDTASYIRIVSDPELMISESPAGYSKGVPA